MTAEHDRLERLRIDRSGSPSRGPVLWPWYLVGCLVILTAAVAFWLARGRAVPVVTADVTEIRLSGGATVLNASGYVTARRRATVSSKVTGKVSEVLIEEGQSVQEGEVLARLDTANTQRSLDLSRAELASARSALAETRVRREEARRELTRQRNLMAERIASQADLDSAQAEVDSLEARLLSQKDGVAVAERQLRVWEQQLEDLTIRAPFDGVVVTKNAQPGEMISPTSAGGGFTRTGIGTIVDMTSLEIEVDVNEAYIGRVQAGQRVIATLDAYPDWKIPCRVIAIIPTADRQKATVKVRISFDSLDDRILPDMGVKVAFQDSEASAGGESKTLVPPEAIRSDGGTDVVFIVRDGTLERRAVMTAGEHDGLIVVAAGLQRGESVVIEGPAGLAEGDRVKVRKP